MPETKPRSIRHDCEAVRKVAHEYGGSKLKGNDPHVASGPFGIGIVGVPLDCLFPDPGKNYRYIPLATHCPYCGEDINWQKA